ncbi:MAG: GNAT family N-acetyltransferase [Desulfobacterales bacterium]|jgi:N-acetylglutamate synthase-like GNAT family acetyltransferase
MPRLYIEEYTRILAGRHVSIACREGILRDHFDDVINDIKFLNRQGIITTLFHNMAHRFANQKHFRTLADRLPETRIVRVRPEKDFYIEVLGQAPVYKLIFLERKYLTDPKGRRLNTLDTRHVRDAWHRYGDLIANASFKSTMEKICQRIDAGHLDRVHILPIRKNTIKHELFTVEGTGTLIANNFQESFLPILSADDEQLVAGILKLYKTKGYLKPRGKAYITAHRENFYMTQIDGIVVGCAELIPIDAQTAELGALAISTRFRGQRVGVFTVNAFIDEARRRGYQIIISLTKNPRLQTLYKMLGFVRRSPRRYAERQVRSPETPMFLKDDI